MFCTKFGDDCSKFVGGVAKKTDLDTIPNGGKSIWTQMGVAYMDGFVWTHKIQEKNLSYRPKYKVHCYGATILPNCTTFDTALHGVSSNTPAKCEVDQMSGSLDMRGTYPRSDRFLDLQLNVLILEPNDKTISELLYFEIYEQVILKEPFFQI